MTLERDLKKLGKQIGNGIAIAAELDPQQLALAISLGIKLQKLEDGFSVRQKIEEAEKTSDSEPATPMQKALLQELGLTADAAATRGDVSYQIIQWYQKNQRTFFQKLGPAFQDRFCGGDLSRFSCLTFRLATLRGTAKGCAIWLAVALGCYIAWKLFL